MSTKEAGATLDRAQDQPISANNLPGPSAAVNPDSETIALLQETVWLLTGIYNLLNEIHRRMP
jgi:hypothetical protein